MHTSRQQVGAFELDGTPYRMIRRLGPDLEVWVEGPGPAFDHRYPVRMLQLPDPTDSTRKSVWIEIAGLICFPGRLGVDVTPLIP